MYFDTKNISRKQIRSLYTLNNFSDWSLLFCCLLDIHNTNFVKFFSVSYQRMLEPKSCFHAVTDFHISGVTSYFEIHRWLKISLLCSTRYTVA